MVSRHCMSVFALLLMFVTTPSYAGGTDASAELYMKLTRMQSLSAHFQQIVNDHEGYVTQDVKGRFHVRQPNKIYWETFAPYEQIVVSNGEKLWIYDSDLEQVTVQEATDLEGPLALLSESLEALQAKYNISQSTTGIEKVFQLVPKINDESSSFSVVRFSFADEHLKSISIVDKLRQTTEIRLNELQVNPNTADSTFEFVVPEGVDIVINEQ